MNDNTNTPVRYCWLSPVDGFSDSWSEEDHSRLDEKFIKLSEGTGWHLIKYQSTFEFKHHMMLETFGITK